MKIGWVAFLGSLISTSAFCQPKPEETKISFTFKAIAFERIPGLEEIFYGEDDKDDKDDKEAKGGEGDEKESLRLPTRNFSIQAEYEGPNPVTFYGRKANDEGELEYAPVASVLMNEEWKKTILVFLPTSKKVALTGRRFEVLPVDAELARFRGGGRHFVNLSETDVAASIGDQKLLVKASASATFTPRVQGDVTTRVPVQFHYRGGDAWRLLSSTRWGMDPRLRTLVFIYEDPRRKRLALRGITDRVR
ncbi:MAG: hypothetical protein CMI32_07190 [Opitutales bacterium]|nr:hypothetical protein [Opitutales bacterium]